jgi:vitamin B12 transporter
MNITKQTTSGLLALLTFLWVYTPLMAQNDIQNDTSKVYKLDEIIVSASRYEEPASSVGRNISVIGKSEIENSVHTSVGGLLAQRQGMHIVGNNQIQGSTQSIFLRNTNSNHTVVMIDGVRISDPSSTGNSVDLSEISLAGIERIEIVRGAHSTLYGSSAIGGVVNIITQKNNESGFNVDLDTQFGSVKGGTYSTQNNLSLSGRTEDGFYSTLALSQDYTNGFDATIDTVSGGGFNPQDKDDFRKLDLYGKVGYSTSNFNIHGSYRRADQSVELDQGAYNDDDNAYQDFDRDLFNYGISASLSDQISLDFEGGYSTLNRNFVNDSSVVDAQGNYDNTYTETKGDGTLWENELYSTYSSDWAKLIVGVEASRQTMNSRSYTYVSSFDFESETDLDSLDLRETINSVFVHSDLNGSLLDESMSALSLVLGGRFADHNRFGSHVTYEINPRVQLSESTLLYASATTGFNAPSLYQLHAPQQAIGAYTSRGNANLKPEESVSYEIGWKQDVTNEIRFELSLFRTNVKNVVEYVYLWDGETEISNLAGSDYRGDTYINLARQQINGIELGLNVQAIPNLSIAGNLSYTNSESVFAPGDIDGSYTGGHHVQVFESGVFLNQEQEINGLTRRPSFSANIQLDYLPARKWKVGLTSHYVGDRDDIYYSAGLGPYGAQDFSEVNGYNLVDLSLQYRLNQNVRFTGRIENVFDTDYQEIIGYQTRGRGIFLKASLSL